MGDVAPICGLSTDILPVAAYYPSRVKGAAVFPESDAASYAIGHMLNVDGGCDAE